MNLPAKISLIALSFIVSSWALGVEGAQPNEYECRGYHLAIDAIGRPILKNVAAGSSSALEFDGLNSGTSKNSLFTGTLIPVGMNILVRVDVTIQNDLMEGAETGRIWIATAADPSTATSFSCSRQ